MTYQHYSNNSTGKNVNIARIAKKWYDEGDEITIVTHDKRTDEILRTTTARKTLPPKRDENREWCKRIADDLDDYIEGRVFKCPECGEIITVSDDREKHLCSCGYIDDIDEFEQLGIYDYLEDVYDIEYRIGTDKQLRSVQIMVACGGPNIYIDTASKRVELYWWTERADYPLSSNAVASIDDWAEELYNW